VFCKAVIMSNFLSSCFPVIFSGTIETGDSLLALNTLFCSGPCASCRQAVCLTIVSTCL
jgi:Zn finger protein HypA/HybF involved in hydrogenase expression